LPGFRIALLGKRIYSSSSLFAQLRRIWRVIRSSQFYARYSSSVQSIPSSFLSSSSSTRFDIGNEIIFRAVGGDGGGGLRKLQPDRQHASRANAGE